MVCTMAAAAYWGYGWVVGKKEESGGKVTKTAARRTGGSFDGGRRTRRTEVMYMAAGHAYIFRIHGRIDCFNIVTGQVEEPQAVLVRALEPLEGMELMAARRGLMLQGPKSRRLLTGGPGRLAQALGLTLAMNGLDLCGPKLYLTAGTPAAEDEIGATTRINVDYAGEWKDMPWRFLLRESPYVSGRRMPLPPTPPP